DAARRSNLCERTAYRRLDDPAFRERVAVVRSRMFSEAVGRLAEVSGKAAETVGKLLDSESESIRLQACKAVLELGPKLREAGELAKRVEELESLLKEGDDDEPKP